MFSLRRWSSQIHVGFHVSGATQVSIQGRSAFRLRDYHPLRSSFPETLRTVLLDVTFNPAHPCIGEMILTYNPNKTTNAVLHFAGLGCSRFARHY